MSKLEAAIKQRLDDIGLADDNSVCDYLTNEEIAAAIAQVFSHVGGFRFYYPEDPMDTSHDRVLGHVYMRGWESEGDVAVYRVAASGYVWPE